MAVFLSTAFRYAKGQSGLPSLLPSRGSISLAKEKSREVGLFCKGLETFCEIFHKEHMDEDITAAIPHQGPQDDVSTKGELIFQSLFDAKETPPGSPGSTTSSSTLLNPQSRKVSPIAIKDFASSDSESKDVHVGLDPAALSDILSSPSPNVETGNVTTKIAGPRSPSPSVETDKDTTKITGPGSPSLSVETDKDTTKKTPCPATLWGILKSNQGGDEAKNGAVAGEETVDVSKEESQGMTFVGEIPSPSVKKDMDITETPSATLPGILASTQGEGEAENRADADEEAAYEEAADEEAADEEAADSSETEAQEVAYVGEVPSPNGQTDKDASEAPGPATLWGILKSTQGEDKANNGANAGEETVDVSKEESQGMTFVGKIPSVCVKKDMDITETPDSTTLRGILASAQGEAEVENRADADEEAANSSETEAQETASVVVEIPSPSAKTGMDASETPGPATLWGILKSNQGDYKAKNRADVGEETADIPKTEAQEMASVVEISSSSVDTDMDTNETPNSATLQGILASTQSGDEAKNTQEAKETADVVETPSPNAETDLHITESPGPPTLWGILESNQGKDEAKNGVDGVEGTAEHDHEPRDQVAGTSSIALPESADKSGVNHAPSLPSACTPTLPPRASTSTQVEKLEIITPVQKPTELTKTQKRRGERKRKAQREHERKKLEEGAEKGVMEEEGGKASEVVA